MADGFSTPLELPLNEETLAAINVHLSPLSPQDILAWALKHLPALYQTTAFGLTGLVALDMLSKSGHPIPKLIFLDTLYHFAETYELVQQVRERYAVDIKVYKPEGCKTIRDFELKHGEELWEKDEDTYDFAVKVCCSSRPFNRQLSWVICRLSPPSARTRSLKCAASSRAGVDLRAAIVLLSSRLRLMKQGFSS
jgi:phosphoadenosine phosphosulfate reductase